jgi:hypothetical protein
MFRTIRSENLEIYLKTNDALYTYARRRVFIFYFLLYRCYKQYNIYFRLRFLWKTITRTTRLYTYITTWLNCQSTVQRNHHIVYIFNKQKLVFRINIWHVQYFTIERVSARPIILSIKCLYKKKNNNKKKKKKTQLRTLITAICSTACDLTGFFRVYTDVGY